MVRVKRDRQVIAACFLLVCALVLWAFGGFPRGVPEPVPGDLGTMAASAAASLLFLFFAITCAICAAVCVAAPRIPAWLPRLVDYVYYTLGAIGVVLFFAADYENRWELIKRVHVPELQHEIDLARTEIDRFTTEHQSMDALRATLSPTAVDALSEARRDAMKLCIGEAPQLKIDEGRNRSPAIGELRIDTTLAQAASCDRVAGLGAMLAVLGKTRLGDRMAVLVSDRALDDAGASAALSDAERRALLALSRWRRAEARVERAETEMRTYVRPQTAQQDRESLAPIRQVRYDLWIVVLLSAFALKIAKTTIELFRLTRDAKA